MLPSFSQVVLTREIEKSEKLRVLLMQQKIPVLLWPLIQIRVLSLEPFRPLLEQRSRYDMLVFPSPNAVHGFFQGLKKITLSWEPWHSIPTAVVGNATASALSQYGDFRPLIPETQEGEGLVKLLTQQNNQRVLLVAGKQSLLPDELQTQQIPFDWIPCYQTERVPLEERPLISLAQSILVFASPSAVESFLLSHSFAETGAVVAIGKTTAIKVQKHFFGPLNIASEPSEQGLLKAIQSLFWSR